MSGGSEGVNGDLGTMEIEDTHKVEEEGNLTEIEDESQFGASVLGKILGEGLVEVHCHYGL